MVDQFDFDVGLDPEDIEKQRERQKTDPSVPILINSRTDINNGSSVSDINKLTASAKDLKAALTPQELKFIENYLVEDMTIDNAMISAGYGSLQQRTRYNIARRIIQKYEARAEDRRNLFRELGAGEVAICQGLLNLARNARSEQVQRAAWADLASCIGLKSEMIETFQGVTLNVYGVEEGRRLGIPGAPAEAPKEEPIRSVMITK
jgi:hypothetical protein